MNDKPPDALTALRERAEGMGLEYHHNQHSNYIRISTEPDSLRRNLQFMLTVDEADDGIQAAHWLLDGYERRDWVTCPNCAGAECRYCNYRGRVPQEESDEPEPK